MDGMDAAELDFFLQALDSTNLELDEVYLVREAARLNLGPDREEQLDSFEAPIGAYLAKIDLMRIGISYRMLLQRTDLNEIQSAFLSGLIAAERKDLWNLNKKKGPS